MPYLLTASRVLIFIVFATSAWSKLRDRSALPELARSLAAIQLAGTGKAAAIALLLAETVTAALLAVPWVPSVVAFAAATALLCALTGGVAVALHRGSHVQCRCFGRSSSPLGRWHLVRNILLLGSAVTGLAITGLKEANESVGGHPGGLVVAGCVGALIAVLVVAAEDIAGVFRPLPTSDQKGM